MKIRKIFDEKEMDKDPEDEKTSKEKRSITDRGKGERDKEQGEVYFTRMKS